MKPRDFAISSFRFVAAAVLMASVMRPALAQDQAYNGAVVDDWTHHHVIFSNPGTMEEALRNGTYEKWQRIVSDPRYRLHWLKRNAAWTEQTTTPTFSFPGVPEADPSVPDPRVPVFKVRRKPLHADWTVSLASGATAQDTYPAKYTFAPIGPPSCTNDFVVFGINVAGKSTNQANLVGVNNLYASPTCTGTVPHVLFAYYVGTGIVQTSPVLSLNGAKVAFVESVTNGAKFHVLTIGTTGNNGASANTPVAPGSGNNASDTAITMSGNVSVTLSSPFVDYTNDVAYVGDDSGNLHKFTGVFLGTPAEVTTGNWPVAVSPAALTGPVYDSVSTNIFVGSGLGNLRCITSSGALCPTNLLGVAGGTQNAVLEAPIVDSTNGTVFATASNTTNSVLLQATTALGSPVRATMGASGTNLYAGAFDNAYFTSVSTGHMYLCGNLTGASTPTLYRISFSNNPPTMNSAIDSGLSFQLVTSGNTGTGNNCTPLTEIFNTSQSADYLFVGVYNHGFNTGTNNCGNSACVMSFVITSAFPTAANAIFSPLSSLGIKGMSGMIIDNVSGTTGASQIYFGNLQASTGVQASQLALH